MANEIKKNDVTREKLIILLAKYIKECSKKLNETTSSVEVSISHDTWCCGFGKNRTSIVSMTRRLVTMTLLPLSRLH